jgi:hypothetical protein
MGLVQNCEPVTLDGFLFGFDGFLSAFLKNVVLLVL